MSIHIHCPNCEKTYSLDEKLEGKKAKCKNCEQVFEIHNDVNIQHKKTTITIEDTHIKPHKMSFILFNGFVFLFTLLFVISLLLSPLFGGAIMVSMIAAVGGVISYWLTIIKYNKESYTITENKIIYNSGSLFSDNSVELKLDKVSIVHSILPFIQHKLFKTGNIIVQSAGSSSSEIVFSQINNTSSVYTQIAGMMKKNGFNLNQDELIQEAKPHPLGIIGEIFGILVGSLIAILYIFAGVANELSSANGYLGIVGFLYIGGVMIYATILFMDLKKRRYDIFKDTIVYKEGFLTKHASFIPMENVSDIGNTQSFLSKIFGLHDIIVSCQGEGNQIVFKNMTQGEKMIKNIKFLKDNIIPREKETTTSAKLGNESVVGYIDKTEMPLNYNKEFTGEYKMDFLRTLIGSISFAILTIAIVSLFEPALIYSILPIIIIIMVGKLISIIFTTFEIENSSIEKKFQFLLNNHTSFSVEKITSVILKQNLLDKALHTCTIKFYSIGSQTPISFINIKKTESLESDILAKIGINNGKQDEIIHTLQAKFGIMNYFKANIGTGIMIGIILLGVFTITTMVSVFGGSQIVYMVFLPLLGLLIPIGILFFVKYIYNILYYSPKRYIREIRENYVFSRSGIIFIDRKYSLLRHIKGVKTKKYPLSDTGDIELNISGETRVGEGKDKKIGIFGLIGGNGGVGGMVSSNSFHAKFITHVFASHDHIDTILNLEPINTEVLEIAKQDIGNSVLGLIILFILLAIPTFGGALIPGVIIIGLTIWFIKVKYYNFEKDRVLYGSGIIYKKRHSILYKNFNFIDKNQGMVNKIFKNGNIGIYTLGSGVREMGIKDIDNYTTIYDLLKTN